MTIKRRQESQNLDALLFTKPARAYPSVFNRIRRPASRHLCDARIQTLFLAVRLVLVNRSLLRGFVKLGEALGQLLRGGVLVTSLDVVVEMGFACFDAALAHAIDQTALDVLLQSFGSGFDVRHCLLLPWDTLVI